MRHDNSFLSNLFNPAAAWTDLGLRALDMTLASAHSVSDGMDRLARASAAVPTQDAPAPAAPLRMPDGDATESGLAAAAQLQSTTIELMMRSWQQWMSTMGTLLSLGAGRGIDASMASQNPWFEAWRKSTENMGMSPAGGSSSERRSSRPARSERSMEHAFATPESKPRRARANSKANKSGKSKTRSSQSRRSR